MKAKRILHKLLSDLIIAAAVSNHYLCDLEAYLNQVEESRKALASSSDTHDTSITKDTCEKNQPGSKKLGKDLTTQYLT